MKSLSVNKNSWHYKLAKQGGYISAYDELSDICSYSRKVLMSALLHLFLVVLGIGVTAFLSVVIVDTLFSIGFSLYYGAYIFTAAGEAGTAVSCMVIMGYGVYLSCNRIDNWFKRRRDIAYENRFNPKQPDGFLKTLYKSYKEKYCVRIQFEDDNETDV